MITLSPQNTELPETYNELITAFMPRPIHDQVGHENALAVIDRLSGLALNDEQEEYLDLLSTLVEAYENDLLKETLTSLPKGLPMLRYLCQENSINGVELGRILGVGRAQASLLLKGKRQLTVAHLQKLSAHFKLSADLFM
ncbi:hypothetical protein QEH52_14050 [Coraliomargarita sp. SDUM461003]|uniref:HTH cro/C1-type domain-containing protein n=1 Tax=Thalassobacterium maritimum TaxID=3041265 RepID=A0ABU1AZE9_9BACT|nr:helix-turn-helix domain-containing protein [Coraliomargarita sp. SDUM461003]MDQ8208644.1 hypothetical protein [Coraliomargarita sp. SDUM461003]